MRFLPYAEAATVPNVIVDGAAAPGTILTLSHWPKSGTPAELRADTSTEIVFNYIDSPRFHVDAEGVSNNHFDEDGLLGIFAMLEPMIAARHRSLLVDAAQAGDFGVFATRQAARIAFVLSAYAAPETSPLPSGFFGLPYSQLAGELYVKLLAELPALLGNLESYRALWEVEDARLSAGEDLIEHGLVTIDDRPDLDLAIVRMANGLGECHPFALHTRTARSRLLVLQGRRAELRYRYEGWVQMASRRPAARVDLSALAAELTREESAGATWMFDGVDRITPRLRLEGASETTIPIENIVRRVEQQLRKGPPAWDPYN